MSENRPCAFCGAVPRCIEMSDIFYAVCSKCNKHYQYAFPGITKRAALNNWDAGNVGVKREKTYHPDLTNTNRRSEAQVARHKKFSKWVYTIDDAEYYTASDVARAIGIDCDYVGRRFRKLGSDEIYVHGHRIIRRLKHEQ